jgi:hypothetical protein
MDIGGVNEDGIFNGTTLNIITGPALTLSEVNFVNIINKLNASEF